MNTVTSFEIHLIMKNYSLFKLLMICNSSWIGKTQSKPIHVPMRNTDNGNLT